MKTKFNYKKYALDYLFEGDKELFNLINLSKEEIEQFINFTRAVEYDNGLKWASGGYAEVIIHDCDNDNQELYCYVACGICNDCERNRTEWEVIYDRKTKKFENM